jgi:hypothetical protein
MARVACANPSPYATPRFIERSEAADRGEFFVGALRAAEASGIYTKQREGFDEATTRKMVKHLQQMLPMEWGELTAYYRKMGWLRVDKKATEEAAKAGARDVVYKAAMVGGEEEGLAAAVTKTYLESTAGAIKQAGENFLRQVDAGQNATTEGLIFAQQMQHLSRFGGYVLGWDQSYGRGLRTQGLRRGLPNATRDADRFLQETADRLGNAGQYQDKFKEIAAKLQGDGQQKVDGINELINLAKRVKFLDDPLKIAKSSMSLEIAGNAWTEVFINGLLSAPGTFVTNAAGVVWSVARPMLQLGAASAYAATGMAGRQMAEQAATEAAAALSAMRVAWRDALELGWHAARTETTLYQAGAETGIEAAITGAKFEELMGRRGVEVGDGLKDTVDTLGQVLRLPSRALLGTDEFAKHLVIRGEVAARAVQRAAREGVDLKDKAALETFIQKEANAAFNLHKPELWEKYKLDSAYNLMNGISVEADRATFQELNPLAQKVNNLLQTAPYLRPFVPFVRTPLNILKQGFVESTGFGAVMNASKAIAGAGFNPTASVLAIQQELLKDPGETFRVAGQIAFTTTVAAAFYGMAMDGQIVGGGPGRWSAGGRGSAAQTAWEKAGNRSYVLKLGDTEIPFDRFGEPVAGVLRMAADMGQYSAYVPQAAQEEWVAAMAGIMVSGLYQATFLRGINDVMDTLSDKNLVLGTKGARLLQNYAATQTPFGGLLNYVDKIVDPYKHAYQGATFAEVMRVHEDTFGTGIFARLTDRIPGAGGATPLLIDQITGEPVPTYPGEGPGGLNPLQMAIPFLPRGKREADAAWQAIFEIKGSYTEKSPSRSGLKVTVREQQELNQEMASIRIGGQTLRQAVLEYRNRPEVRAYVDKRGAAFMDVRTKIEQGLDSIINDYYDVAYNRVIQSNSGMRERYMLLEGSRNAAMANNASEASTINQQIDALYERARRGY